MKKRIQIDIEENILIILENEAYKQHRKIKNFIEQILINEAHYIDIKNQKELEIPIRTYGNKTNLGNT